MSTTCSCWYSKKAVLGSVLGAYLIGLPAWGYAATSNSAILQWAANTESDLAGYKVYHGTAPGVYGVSLNVGKTTTYQYANLETNKTHYFSVTAYDTSGNESTPAPEVSKTITGTSGMVLSVSVTGNGTITSTPSGVTCSSGTCSGTFTQGTSVTLAATPSSGSSFSGWGGACSGTGSCAVTLSASATVSAAFSTTTSTSLKTLSVSLAGNGGGTVTSVPSGLTCSSGTCSASFPFGTSVALTATPQSGSTLTGWNGVCSGTSSCTVNLASSQSVGVTFTSQSTDSSNPPKPTMPFFVNFQPPSSQVPANFKKDDGSLFDSSRGYGWSQLVNGLQCNSSASQATNTFVSTSNTQPSTWNMAVPNGTYFVTLVLGDPEQAQGPHWVAAEGLQLTKQVKTSKGEYLTIVDYPVEVKDNTLSLKLGGDNQGQTLINFLMINSTANQSLVTKVLSDNFGTSLITPSLVAGGATKVNPDLLVKLDKENRAKKQKEVEMAKLNDLKDHFMALKERDKSVSLRNLLRGR